MTKLSSELVSNSATGNQLARDQLFKAIYHELKGYANYALFRGGRGVTLSATVVVHEAWLKISVDSRLDWSDRSHFFRISAMAVRQIVIDEIRRKRSLKRGSGQANQEFDESIHSHSPSNDFILSVHSAMEELKAIDPTYCDIIECRFFAGYSEEETAKILNLSLRTVQRYWSEAKKLMKASFDET